ncbi:MAG: DUF3604 domain-containing protein [Planctomycetota bacterium]
MRAALAVLFVTALAAALLFQGCGGGEEPATPNASSASDAAPATGLVAWASGADEVALEPSAARDAAGDLWIAWLRFEQERGDARVEAARMRGAEVVGRIAIEGGGVRPAVPHLTPVGDRVACVWEAGEEGERALYATLLSPRADGLAATPAARVAGTEAALSPRLAADGGGGLLLVFQREDTDRGLDLYLARGRADAGELAWDAPTPLVAGPEDAWSPRLAAGSGGVHLVYDRFDGRSFDVLWAWLQDGELRDHRVVAAGAGFEAYAEVASDGAGGCWIAYESAAQFGASGGLRAGRGLHLVHLKDGRLREADVGALVAPDERAQLPRVACTPGGVALSYRSQLKISAPGAPKRDPFPFLTTWRTRLVTFGADGAPEQVTLTESDGAGDATETLFADAHGAGCVLTSDQRSRSFQANAEWGRRLEQRWRVGRFAFATELGLPALGPARELARVETGEPVVRWRTEHEPGAPFAGDLHRHSDLSRCAGRSDGTIEDAYRYARGPGRLDFVALADHFQHLTPWSWWRSARDVARYHSPGRLVAFLGVERMIPGQGHQNLIFGPGVGTRTIDLARFLGPVDGMGVAPEDVLAVPHMMATDNAFAWDTLHPEHHHLVELYQGNRGSYEGEDLPYQAEDYVPGYDLKDGLASGGRFGVIASSDHSATSSSIAGVYAGELTRASLFDAMRGRHTFAATGPARLTVSLGDLPMGSAGPAPDDARLVVTATAPRRDGADGLAALAYIEVVRNGEVVERRDGPPAAAGEEETELFVLKVRPTRVDIPLVIGAEGARLDAVTSHVPDPTAWRQERGADGAVTISDVVINTDLVLELTRRAGTAAALTLTRGERHASIPLDEIPAGRSIPIGRELPLAARLLRLGRPLGEAGVFDLALPTPALRPGDAYYVRIAWTDGRVAWSSPIWLTEVR